MRIVVLLDHFCTLQSNKKGGMESQESTTTPLSRQKSTLSTLLERQEKEISELIQQKVSKHDRIAGETSDENLSSVPSVGVPDINAGSTTKYARTQRSLISEANTKSPRKRYHKAAHRTQEGSRGKRPTAPSDDEDVEHILSIFVNPHHGHLSAIRSMELRPHANSSGAFDRGQRSPTPQKLNSYVLGKGANPSIVGTDERRRRRASAQIFGSLNADDELVAIRNSLGSNGDGSESGTEDGLDDEVEEETVESCAIKNLAPGVAVNPDVEITSFRGKIVFFIHSNRVQAVLLVLLLVDVMLVIAELVLQSYNICQFYIKRELCLEVPEGSFPLLEDPVDNSSGYFSPTGCGAFANAVMPHSLHQAETILMWCSRGILLIFATELLVLVACLGRYFFTLLYTIDSIIISTSIILSFIFDGNLQEESATALIIFLRCWRFARVLHGFGITIHNWEDQNLRNEETSELDEAGFPTLHNLSQRHRDELLAYCDELEHLRVKLLKEHSLPEDYVCNNVDPLSQTGRPSE